MSKITANKKCINCNRDFASDKERCPDCSLPLTPIINDLDQGEVIGESYEIESLIGDGGMGKIYKASHKLMKRKVAIKMLHSGLVGQPTTLARFKKEAEASSSLDHTNIVTTFDFGLTPDGRPYLVMDYLEGKSFDEILNSEKLLEPKRCLKLFIQMCAGFDHAHSKGIIHRDIKPSNILVVNNEKNEEVVKILDFGIAKKVSTPEEKRQDEVDSGNMDLTEAGTVFGSPLYMSPEQVRGEELDFKSDIYSLSCLLYQSLTGTPVYQADDPIDFMHLHVNKEPEPFTARCPTSNIPDSLQKIVLLGLKKEPGERIQSMEEFKNLLEKELELMSVSASSTTTEKVEEVSIDDSPKESDSKIDTVSDSKKESEKDNSLKMNNFDFSNLLTYLVPLLVTLLLIALTAFTDTHVFDAEKKSNKNATTKIKRDEKKTKSHNNKADSSKEKKAKNSDDKKMKVSSMVADTDKSSQDKEISQLKSLLRKGKEAYDRSDCLVAQEKFIEANKLAKKLDINSVEYLDSVYGLGKTLLKRKKYQKALTYLNWAYKKIESKYGGKSSYARAVKRDIQEANQSLAK